MYKETQENYYIVRYSEVIILSLGRNDIERNQQNDFAQNTSIGMCFVASLFLNPQEKRIASLSFGVSRIQHFNKVFWGAHVRTLARPLHFIFFSCPSFSFYFLHSYLLCFSCLLPRPTRNFQSYSEVSVLPLPLQVDFGPTSPIIFSPLRTYDNIMYFDVHICWCVDTYSANLPYRTALG